MTSQNWVIYEENIKICRKRATQHIRLITYHGSIIPCLEIPTQHDPHLSLRDQDSNQQSLDHWVSALPPELTSRCQILNVVLSEGFSCIPLCALRCALCGGRDSAAHSGSRHDETCSDITDNKWCHNANYDIMIYDMIYDVMCDIMCDMEEMHASKERNGKVNISQKISHMTSQKYTIS